MGLVDKGIYESFAQAKKTGQKKFAVLIDPDKVRLDNMQQVIDQATEANVDYFFIGGSLVVNNMLDH